MNKETVKKIILWTQDALHYGKITGSDDEIAENCMKEIEFDVLCDPDIYEASYNEQFEAGEQIEQKERESAEEIIVKYEPHKFIVTSKPFDKSIDVYYKQQVIEAMEEYAAQSRQPEISDSEIEKYFTSQHYDNKNGHHYRVNKDRIFGAKAMRDHPEHFKIKPQNK
jgi:hypothetical protein